MSCIITLACCDWGVGGGYKMGNEGEIELSVTIYDVTSLPLTVGH